MGMYIFHHLKSSTTILSLLLVANPFLIPALGLIGDRRGKKASGGARGHIGTLVIEKVSRITFYQLRIMCRNAVITKVTLKYLFPK